jgi:rRNA maturation endonuclease Nob1
MSVVQRIHEFLSDGQDRTPARLQTSNLYRCESCNITYISVEMASCSSCGAAVDAIPTERDLGLT